MPSENRAETRRPTGLRKNMCLPPYLLPFFFFRLNVTLTVFLTGVPPVVTVMATFAVSFLRRLRSLRPFLFRRTLTRAFFPRLTVALKRPIFIRLRFLRETTELAEAPATVAL